MNVRRDPFCWKCHESETDLSCHYCERTFHSNCIPAYCRLAGRSVGRSTDRSNGESVWKCGECRSETPAAHDKCDQLSAHQLNQLLLYAFGSIKMSADYYFSSANCAEDSKWIARPMSLAVIESRLKSSKYRSANEFVSDVKLILHNTILKNMETSLVDNALVLVKRAKSEVCELRECPNCFRNYYTVKHSGFDNWFSEPCWTPHTLVWAHVRGHPYWPAKAFFCSNKNSIFVRFFATYEKGWVKEKDCYLMSEDYPFSEIKDKTLKDKFSKALKELRHYILCLNRSNPGLFKYAKPKTRLNIDKITESLLLSNSNNDETIISETENKSENTKNDRMISNLVNGNFPNRPIGWRPTARKSISNSSQMTEENPFEISPLRVTANKMRKKVQNKLNIEIIPCNAKNDKLLTNNITNGKKCLPRISPKKNISFKKIENLSPTKKMRQKLNFMRNNTSKAINKTKKDSIEVLRRRRGRPPKSKTLSDGECSPKSPKLKEEKNNSQIALRNELKILKERINHLEEKILFNQSMHEQHIREIQHNSNLVLLEVRASWVAEKERALNEERKSQIEKRDTIVAEAKGKYESEISQLNKRHELEMELLRDKCDDQIRDAKINNWCVSCLKLATIYCCSNGYYCGDDCQTSHWTQHSKFCTQKEFDFC